MAAIDLAKQCTAGYVCYEGSATATPTDGTKGEQCIPGHFCVTGTTTPTPCFLGSYRETVGAALATECTTCVDGEQCNQRGLLRPTTNDIICDAGSYCPDATTSRICDRGYYCPANVQNQIICANGDYQPNQ